MARPADPVPFLVPATLLVWIASAAPPIAGELSPQVPSPRAPLPRPSGGASPFRGPGVKGTSFDAASLEQPGCPIHLSIEALRRTERGVTLTIRLSNLVDGSITRQVVGAWVLVADGTLRGYQKLESDRPLLEAASRVTDMRLRTVNVMPNDIIILAVHEARSNDGIWRRDQAELQEEVRRTLLP